MNDERRGQPAQDLALVDQYLLQVGAHLPNQQREDILRELRGTLCEEIDAHIGEGEANADQLLEVQSDVLRRFGHPLKVASEFAETRFVIGPRLYPAFVYTLKVVAGILCAIFFSASILAGVVSGWTTSFFDVVISAVEVVLWGAAVVFSVFWVLDYTGERLSWYEGWQPAQLSRHGVGTVDRGRVITDLVSTGVFLLWWNDVLRLRDLIPVSEGVFTLSLGSIWDPFFWPLNLLFALCFVVYTVVLVRGIWFRWHAVVDFVTTALLLGIGCVLVLGTLGEAGMPLLVAEYGPDVIPDDGNPSALAIMQQNVSRIALISLLVVCGMFAKDLYQSGHRLRSMRRLNSIVAV